MLRWKSGHSKGYDGGKAMGQTDELPTTTLAAIEAATLAITKRDHKQATTEEA